MYAKKVKKFSYRGYTCFVRELGYNPGEISTQIAFALQDKWFCGYVAVDVDDDKAMEIDCHGGITWHGKNLIGFDCNHIDDNPIVLNDIFCEIECKRIVDQLIEMNIPPYTGNDSYTYKVYRKEEKSMKINKENTAKAIGKVKSIAAENKPIGEWTLNELHDYCEYIQKTYNHNCLKCKVNEECSESLIYCEPCEWDIGGLK